MSLMPEERGGRHKVAVFHANLRPNLKRAVYVDCYTTLLFG
jgi:hypothetical protein